MPNPFFYGGHITDPTQFVGRRAELRRTFAALEAAHTGQIQSISVVGPRRIGKSSLLHQLTQVYARDSYLAKPEHYRFVYISLHDAECHTRTGLLHKILSELLPKASKRALPLKPSLVQFQDTLRGLKQQGVWPIICIDEFEELTQRPDQFNNDFFDSWRHMMSASNVAFITGSAVPLNQLVDTQRFTSHFFNVFTLLELGDFTPDEAQLFLARGRMCDRPFSDAECEEISALAGRHPYKLQVACSLLYQAKERTPRADWRALKHDFQRQLDFVFYKPTPPPRAARGWAQVQAMARALLRLPRTLGMIALDLIGSDDASDLSRWVVGAVILALLVALVLGFVTWQQVKETWQSLSGATRP